MFQHTFVNVFVIHNPKTPNNVSNEFYDSDKNRAKISTDQR